jgi:hypothetical protein
MDITARINNHEKKRSQNNTDSLTASILSAKPPQPENAPLQSPAQPPQPVSPPSPSQEIIQAANTDDIRNVKIDIPGTPQNNGSADWRSLDYDSAVKFNPDLSVSQYISGASQYRKENNQPGFSDMELYALLGGKDPYKSKKELDEEEKQRSKDEKRLRAGYYVDSIGNLLANLINYTRTTKGNPAMDLRGLGMNRGRLDNERSRLQQLRLYHDNLARSNYKDYMDKLKEQRAREAAATAVEAEFQHKLTLEQMKQSSPLTKKKEETEEERRKGLEANRKLVEARAEAQRKENESYEEKAKLEADYLKERIKSARNGDNKSGSRGKKQPLMARLKNNDSYSKDEYNLNDDKDVMKMYRQGVELGLFPEYTLLNDGEKVLDPSKMDPDKLRNIILYSGKYVTEDDEDYDRVLSYPNKKPSLGWGVSSKDNKDEDQLDW